MNYCVLRDVLSKILKGVLVGLLSVITLNAQATFNVKDPALNTCLQDIARAKSWQHAGDFKRIKCHNKAIKSLQGLAPFKNIESLSLYNNKLKAVDIDLKQFSALKSLNIARNNIQHLSLEQLPHLKTVYAFDNAMRKLHLSTLPSLKKIKANNNRLTQFQYADTPKLHKIYIFNNKLKTVNINNLPALEYMDCRQNPMPDALYDKMDAMEDVTFLHDGNAEDW